MVREIIQVREFSRNRRLSADELSALQNKKLGALVRHAYKNVPYYQSLFKSAGLSPDDIRSVSDLKKIPITTKDDLRRAGLENILAKGIDISSCRALDTSGSTGEPFRVYFSKDDLRKRRAYEFCTLLAIGLRPFDRLAVLGPSRPHKSRLHQLLGFYRSDNISPVFSIEYQIKELISIKPTVLWSYPTVLNALLHKIDYTLSKLINPSKLITSAEIFNDSLKNRLKADMNIEMFNFYGSIESGRVAAECRAHEGLHVNSDHVILECLKENGEAKQTGLGASVVTNLDIFTMPFIRYRLGDLFRFKEKRCYCGSSFPLIDPPIGRDEDMVRLPSSRILSALPFMYILRGISSIHQFRVIQESLDHFVIQIAWRTNPVPEQVSNIRSRFTDFFAEPVRLDIENAENITDEKLKFRHFISKVKPKE